MNVSMYRCWRQEIVPDAEQRLLRQDLDRERAISVIRELADMARFRTTWLPDEHIPVTTVRDPDVRRRSGHHL